MELEFSDDCGLELEYAEVYTEYFEILKKISQKILNMHRDRINAVQMQLGEQFE